ncbi:hypothetical protein [Sphingobacterium deserti]|uniref:Uncharacterized protein n=1 Tax=Sphingobacterium deserti TaxID=1229276 RepID=A0A0B8T1A6_9SPHI|nr:hypothetical protein [Sphingobacterium deserti]KGE14471.1 hypothetical protein DI53_1500 [Sphingobacterium deserti]
MKVIPILLLLLSLCLNSCTAIFMRFMGVQNVQNFDQELYEKNASALMATYSGPKLNFAVSDTSFIRYATLFDSLESRLAAQPIQMLYFNTDRKLESFHTNCLVPGAVGKLKWNIDDRFSHYIPKTAAAVDHEQWNFHDLTNKLGIDSQTIPPEKDVVVFLWSRLLNKQVIHANKEMISNIQNNLKAADFPVILYVNTDKVYASLNKGVIDSTFLRNVLTEEEYEKRSLKSAQETLAIVEEDNK